MGVVHTSEFQQSFEAQTARMLRPRFMWFLAAVGVIFLLSLVTASTVIALAIAQLIPGQTTQAAISHFRWGMVGIWLFGGLVLLDVAVYAWCWVRILRRPMGREEMVRFTQRYLVFRGLMDVVATTFVVSTPAGFPWAIMLYHVLACIFLPWSPAQALKPIGPVLVINAIAILLLRESQPWVKAILMVLSLFAAAPGLGIVAIKQSRRMELFRLQMLQARYGQMRQELVDARRIHEALFPSPIQDGPVRLDYRYEPMRQIGGDYLYARFAPCEREGDGAVGAFNVLLLDVTGHGIAAALTVNRLYGEVERLFAERPNAGPGEVLSALNHYVHLTLANHSIYATALCLRFDYERGVLEYASGGHPPAYVCSSAGTIESLDSTALVLGACAGRDFDPCVQERRFERGDTLLAYTDGAIEARSEHGKMLGVQGLLRALSSCSKVHASGGLAAAILQVVESHRCGPPEDDTLVVEVHFPAKSDTAMSMNGEAKSSRQAHFAGS